MSETQAIKQSMSHTNEQKMDGNTISGVIKNNDESQKIGIETMNILTLNENETSPGRTKVQDLGKKCEAAQVCHHHGLKFSYEGPAGPENWWKLEPENAIAKYGKEQSPVNIVSCECCTKDPEKPTDLEIKYEHSARGHIQHNGHTVQVDWPVGEIIITDPIGTLGKRKVFKLVQFHFHTPSENTLDGVSFPMEGHYVHAAEDGQLAVVAVFYKEGAENEFLAQFWDDMPMKETPKPFELVQDIMSKPLCWDTNDYFRLMGSLTTPPCTEGVIWTLLPQIHSASPHQLAKFKSAIPGKFNNRPLCPLNKRNVVRCCQ